MNVQQLLLEIIGDSGGAQKAVNDLIAGLKGLDKTSASSGEEAFKLGEKLKEAFDHPTEAVKSLGKQMAIGLLDELGAVGLAVSAVTVVVTGLAAALYEVTTGAAEVGDKISDLSATSGLNVEATSAMKYAFEIAGSSGDKFANTMFQLERRMASSPKKVAEGLGMIGLSLEQIQNLKGEERFLAIAEAIRDTEDPTLRAGAAMAIFGNQGRTLLPILTKDLRGFVNEARELGYTWSEYDQKAAEDLIIAQRQLQAQWEQLKELLGKAFIDTLKELTEGLNWVVKLGLMPIREKIDETAAAIRLLKVEFLDFPLQEKEFFAPLWRGLEELPKPMEKAKDGMHVFSIGLAALKEEVKSNAIQSFEDDWVRLKILTDEATKSDATAEAQRKKSREEQQKWNDLIKDVTSNTGDWYSITKDMDGEVKEALTYYLQHGVNVEKLAKMYGLTAAEVGAVNDQLKLEQQLAKQATEQSEKQAAVDAQIETQRAEMLEKRVETDRKSNEGFLKNIKAQVDAYTNAEDIKNKATLNSFEYEKTIIMREQNEKMRALDSTKAGYADALAAIAYETNTRMGEAERSWKEHLAEMDAATNKWGNLVTHWLDAVPGLVAQAFTGGGGLKGAFDAIFSKMGADTLAKYFSGPEGLGAKVASGVGGKLGANLGKLVGGLGGPLGSIAGSFISKGLSALMGIGGPSKKELEGRKVEEQFEKQFGSFDKMMKAVNEAYVMTGKTAANAEADVKRLMDAEKKGGDAVKAVIDDIQKQMDLQKKAAEALPGLLQNVAGGMNAIAAGTIGSFNRWHEQLLTSGDQLVSLREQEAKLKAQIDELNKKDHLTPAQKAQLDATIRKLADIQTEITKLNSANDYAAKKFKEVGENGQEAFDRIGRLAMTSFHAEIAGGKSFLEALTAIGPTLNELATAQQTFGFTSNETLQKLLEFRQFAENNKELIGTIDGVNQMMDSLHKMGLLTQQDFDDLNAVASDTFNQMVEQGISGDDAMRAMQPTLQRIWEMQHDYGMIVDENTEKILAQAEQQGIVGEKMKSVQQQTLDVLKAIAKALGADIPDALNKLPKEKTIDINFEAHKTGDWDVPGALTEEIPSFAGRPMERVTSTGYALLHPGDVVGVPQPGQFGGGIAMSDVLDALDRNNDLLDSMPEVFARKIRDAMQLTMGIA